MNIRQYYKERKKIEDSLPNGNVLVVSLQTSDGGREGVMSQIDRRTAATLIVENRARLATDEETASLRKSRTKG